MCAPTFVFASDSFKGTLSSARIAELLSEEAIRVFPEAECRRLIVADGGEGTAEAIAAQADAEIRKVSVPDPLGRPVEAHFALLSGGRAVLEMAAASGLTLLSPDERNPLRASSFGTGQLMQAALDAGSRDLTIGIGGSATVDGGMGALRALGVRFFDATGAALSGCGADLAKVARIDASGLDSRLPDCRIRVMCDVDNPLLGDRGAARVFGPQKGADPRMVERLEAGMANYAQVVGDALAVHGLVGESAARRHAGAPAMPCSSSRPADPFVLADQPGAGAAGGMGFALAGFLGAELVPGIECVLDLVDFDALLAGADLCVTGEGRLDTQTLRGKAPAGIAAHCRRAGVPCAVIAGSIAPEIDVARLAACGMAPVLSVSPDGLSADEIARNAEERYRLAARRLFSELARHDD